jgi:hypothetical protein
MKHWVPAEIANMAVNAVEKKYQWQPIATAPYDTMIFVLYQRGQIGTIVLDSGYDKPKTITHWLPIPPLPKI